MKLVISTILALAVMGGGPAVADCTAKVQEAFAKLRAEKSFRQETKITDPKRGSLSMQTDFVLPDRMHQRVSAGDSSAVMETIVVGQKVFSNGGQGWAEVPDNFAKAIVKQLKTIAAPSQSELTYKCGDDQELEGKTFTTFQAELPASGDGSAKAAELSNAAPRVQTLYVNKQTGVPVHNIVADGKVPEKIWFNGTFTLVEGLKIQEPDLKK